MVEGNPAKVGSHSVWGRTGEGCLLVQGQQKKVRTVSGNNCIVNSRSMSYKLITESLWKSAIGSQSDSGQLTNRHVHFQTTSTLTHETTTHYHALLMNTATGHTFSVPKNNMCSQKWANPGTSSGSQKQPAKQNKAHFRLQHWGRNLYTISDMSP